MRMFKAIIGGALLGAALFFVPFILIRVFLFVLLIGFLFRLFGRGRWHGQWNRGFGHSRQSRFAFPDYIRSMSDEEYSRFKQHFGGFGGRRQDGSEAIETK
jgi:uncharacterized membrane protein